MPDRPPASPDSPPAVPDNRQCVNIIFLSGAAQTVADFGQGMVKGNLGGVKWAFKKRLRAEKEKSEEIKF